MNIRRLYYTLKPIIPRRLQLELRSRIVVQKRFSCGTSWPIDEKAAQAPEKWSGWPEKKQFALVLTHDVETENGQSKCHNLIELEAGLGFRSSFNFVPERYQVSPGLRDYLTRHGFEIGVHGLTHDGKLYRNKKIFQQRAIRINHYLKEWNAVGFRSPAMHHNLEWIHDLNIQYDASTFDTDPFEFQPHGTRTIFPFWVHKHASQSGYVELPYTLPQDFTLFILMQERDIKIWQKKLDWVVKHGGMVLLNTHPDYMNFHTGKREREAYPADYYAELLKYIERQYGGQYWLALPKEMAQFWSMMYRAAGSFCGR
ncbi:MAG: hypothetical protein OEU26_07565 [Candidatus Tectomicrobia bacterium]|nr:hypothetical protein [Candidatus Tectomicrobia bacterium]